MLYIIYVNLINNKKGYKMNNENIVEEYHNIVYDDITNYGITIINNEMYLIKDGKRMKLDALIIKERKGN